MLQPTHIIAYLTGQNQLERLVGGNSGSVDDLECTLLEFWRRYARTWPSHQVFAEGNSQQLRHCIPCYVHGDDGRSFKKSGVLIVNLQGAIGQGSQPFVQKHSPCKKFRDRSMGLNVGGHSYGSRLLYCSMQRKFFAKKPEVFQRLMANLAEQLLELQRGFEYKRKRWHIICLGVKGDLPWLTKAGTFERHFLRAQRTLNPRGTECPAGICHLCHAGRSRIPCEDFTDSAAWATDGCDEPWQHPPSFMKLYHEPEKPSSFFKLDLFHNFHGGSGKDWVASAMTEMLVLMGGTSREAKIDEMAHIMRAWSQGNRKDRPHSGDFCSERIGLTSYQVCPEASWSKHNDTTIYMRFLQHFLLTHPEHREHQKLRLIYAGTCAVNLALQLLYESGLWIPREIAHQAGSLGRLWLAAYCKLARITHAEGFLRFPLHPKLHYLDHQWRQLQAHAQSSQWVYNVVNESVQMDEAAWHN